MKTKVLEKLPFMCVTHHNNPVPKMCDACNTVFVAKEYAKKHTEEVLKDLLPQKEEIFELTYEQFCKDKDSFKMLMFEQALKEGKNLGRQQIIDKAKEKYNITIK
jgi:hypothetical protein